MPAAEKTEAPPAAPAAPARQALFSPTGAIIVFVLLVLEGVGVYLVSKSFGGSKGGESSIDTQYVEVDLGSFTRDIPSGTVETALPKTFSMKVSLILNPNFENIEEVKGEVEKKKNYLRDRVLDILNRKNTDYFRQENVKEDLALTLKQQLNQLLRTKDGQDKIEKVIFPEFQKPPTP